MAQKKQVWLTVLAESSEVAELDIFKLEIKKQLFDKDLVHIFVGRLLEAQHIRDREEIT